MAPPAPPRGPPPNTSLPARVQSIPPNQTLYITNLPSAKIQKADLRQALYMIFSTHGPVLHVVALKTMKMRGQAHVVFRDVQTATQAMRTLDGFEFLGRPMKIQYAKSKSNWVAKLDGTYKMPNTTAGAANVEVTDLQQSIFNAPAPGASAASGGLPTKPPPGLDRARDAGTPESRGQKRPRDEEDEDEDEDEDESDDDVAMEEDSEED